MTESNIYQKIAKVILHEATQKISKGNQGYSSDDVYAALRTAMAENNLICIPQFNEHYMQDGQNWVSFTFTLIDADSGDKLESTWYQIVPAPNKMMTIDKCIGAASTYAHKYFLMRTFMLTSSDDPKIDAPQSDEQIALEVEVKAKNELLNKLLADKTLRSEGYYPHETDIKDTMKLYKDEFGTDPLVDDFHVVMTNLKAHKDDRAIYNPDILATTEESPQKEDVRKELVGKELNVISIKSPSGQTVGREIYWEAYVDYDEVPGNVPIKLYDQHFTTIAELLGLSELELKSLLVVNPLDVSSNRLVIIPDWHKGLRMDSAFIDGQSTPNIKPQADHKLSSKQPDYSLQGLRNAIHQNEKIRARYATKDPNGTNPHIANAFNIVLDEYDGDSPSFHHVYSEMMTREMKSQKATT